ncbi:hypothetical protein AB0F57_12555 [Streptomyces tanashiensis]|uniref:hypothetical protein n=1 Tax=Streptomyces tanashiensis TaxID=67367 RepID=UPI0033DDDA30
MTGEQSANSASPRAAAGIQGLVRFSAVSLTVAAAAVATACGSGSKNDAVQNLSIAAVPDEPAVVRLALADPHHPARNMRKTKNDDMTRHMTARHRSPCLPHSLGTRFVWATAALLAGAPRGRVPVHGRPCRTTEIPRTV